MEIKTLIKEKSSKSRDPYILYFKDLYYYCFSRDDKIYICASKDLELLENAEEIVVYKNENGLKNMLGPELHVINNKCYIYFSADDGNNENHKMYVLYNDSNNPLEEYKSNGPIKSIANNWATDGTILRYQNGLYFIWSGCDKNNYSSQDLFIAKMETPYQICTEKTIISTSKYDWEKYRDDQNNLVFVNEGPAILTIENNVYIFYSASSCWSEDYCIGLLELIGDKPLLAASWKKHIKPIFTSNNQIIGPGHCSFTTTKNNEKIMLFHSFNDKSNLDLQNVNSRYIKLNYSNINL